MTPRTTRMSRHSLAVWTFALLAGLSETRTKADPIYTITGLGTLSGQSSSVATSINNQGQVVGISYNSSDGYFTAVYPASGSPPRFTQTGNGAESFLYNNGQMTQVSPTGGLAMSINGSGQVVGGPYSSINDSGQYVGSAWGGIQDNYNNTGQLISGATITALNIGPYAINSSGAIAGFTFMPDGEGSRPVVYRAGEITDLSSSVPTGFGYDSRAIAINQNGDVLITLSPTDNSIHSYLYDAATGRATEIPTLAGSPALLAAALNDKDQAVGNGFLYSNGTTQALASLLPVSSGWTNLDATAINDYGQIVGQGTYDGQQVAFLMAPDVNETPEPGALAVWALIASVASARLARKSMGRAGRILTHHAD